MKDLEKQYYKLFKSFAEIINSSLDVTEVLNMIAENFVKSLNIKASTIFLLDRTWKTLKVRASYGLSDAYLNKGSLDANKSIVETLDGKSVMIYDLTNDSRVQYPKEAKKEGIASILSVPITVMGKIIGELRLYTSEPYEFSEDEREFISDLADMGAVAIDRAQYFKSFRDVSTLISKSLNLKEVLDSITRNLARSLITKGCAIYLLSKVENRLNLQSSYGLSDEYLNKGVIDAEKSIAGCLDGNPVFVRDVTTDPRIQYGAEAEKEGVASTFSVPISAKGQIIGVLRIYTAKPHEFTQNETEFIFGITEMGGIAIENANMYDRLKGEHEKLINDTHRWFEYGNTTCGIHKK
ncbi:MAG: GAF domain-containing protein [Deltaproteobacteria bacterium]|nr:GAF domain-containing protein [Deltaproteobacteria bacterium]MBW2203065.1 GAF domain-containing protein [Deltaproteobacteria bacterium]